MILLKWDVKNGTKLFAYESLNINNVLPLVDDVSIFTIGWFPPKNTWYLSFSSNLSLSYKVAVFLHN